MITAVLSATRGRDLLFCSKHFRENFFENLCYSKTAPQTLIMYIMMIVTLCYEIYAYGVSSMRTSS